MKDASITAWELLTYSARLHSLDLPGAFPAFFLLTSELIPGHATRSLTKTLTRGVQTDLPVDRET